MARYGCQTMGRYAEMLWEDAVAAASGKVRDESGEGSGWVDAPEGFDAAAEVSAAVREIAHHLAHVAASARAMEAAAGAQGADPDELLREYMARMAAEEAAMADGWAWVYGEDGEDGGECE